MLSQAITQRIINYSINSGRNKIIDFKETKLFFSNSWLVTKKKNRPKDAADLVLRNDSADYWLAIYLLSPAFWFGAAALFDFR